MPLYEHFCPNNRCRAFAVVEEHYFSSMSSQDPPCDTCGTKKKRCISDFAIPLNGLITARYNDPKLEGSHMEGHFAWRKKTPDGVPQKVWIETFEQRKKFMKEEGLVGYEDTGPIAHDSNGKRSSTRTGMPGCWA